MLNSKSILDVDESLFTNSQLKLIYTHFKSLTRKKDHFKFYSQQYDRVRKRVERNKGDITGSGVVKVNE